jgi:hypothetical protein
MADIADCVPGGIKPTDVWKQLVNNGRCSRCFKLVSNYEKPLLLFSDDGDAMLLYCRRCLEIPALSPWCPEALGEPDSKAQGGPHPITPPGMGANSS